MIYINDMPKPFREGMTVADAFNENNIKIRQSFLIMVNDETVDYSDYSTFELHDGDDIQQMYPFFVEM
ncbi:MAG: MoaD/ThiS family protein [Bacillota bacterium]|nr:MoaD/ThiS family protein [Bacillota bacterium]